MNDVLCRSLFARPSQYHDGTNPQDQIGTFLGGLMTRSRNEMKRTATACLSGLLWFSPVASGQTTETKLIPDDGAVLDGFGTSVSVSGDYAIVGASGDDDNGAGSGSAYIFKRDGINWIQHGKLLASDGNTIHSFGASVSISADYAVVGTHTNTVYIFKRHGVDWIEEAKLTGPAYFGWSVSISGDHIIVGAYVDGSAYIFSRLQTGWIEEARLTPTDGTAFWFGRSVAISHDRAIVGAPYDDDYGIVSGSAYIYRRDGNSWTEEEKIHASDAAAEGGFGYSVSISGDYAAIGGYIEPFAGKAGASGYSIGTAYIFHHEGGTWTEQAKFHDGYGAHFAHAVSISGDYAIVGADGQDFGDYPGYAFLFRRNGSDWTEEAQLTPSDGDGEDHFGFSVSISGNDLIAGAPSDDVNGDFSGSAYLYAGFTNTLCADITSMVARCIGGDTKTVQVRVNLLNNIIHEGDSVTIAIDGNPFTASIISNGTSSRANFSIPGWSVGDHIVSLISPAGCLADVHATCVAGDGIAKADPYWDDDAGWSAPDQDIPKATTLLDNYPNPFNPSTSIQYALSEDVDVTLTIYSMLGQVVATLVDEPQTAGYKSVVWNGRNDAGATVASGIYIYRITAGTFTETKRMLLLK